MSSSHTSQWESEFESCCWCLFPLFLFHALSWMCFLCVCFWVSLMWGVLSKCVHQTQSGNQRVQTTCFPPAFTPLDNIYQCVKNWSWFHVLPTYTLPETWPLKAFRLREFSLFLWPTGCSMERMGQDMRRWGGCSFYTRLSKWDKTSSVCCRSKLSVLMKLFASVWMFRRWQADLWKYSWTIKHIKHS